MALADGTSHFNFAQRVEPITFAPISALFAYNNKTQSSKYFDVARFTNGE